MTSRRLWAAFGLALLAALSLPAYSTERFDGPEMPYDGFETLPGTEIRVLGGVLDVRFAPGELVLSREAVFGWIRKSAAAVVLYYGRFPVHRARLLIVPVPGNRVRHGKAYGYRGAAVKIFLGRQAGAAALEDDWIMVHEMIHLAFPSMPRRHNWFEEGQATYVESIARLQAGDLSEEFVWGGFVKMMHHGLPKTGDRGLDRTPTWGRRYWGGALFCLLADVEIRRRTGNRYGLQDALRAVVEAGGRNEIRWPLHQALEIGDRATGVAVLSELYEQMKETPVEVDLAGLWRDLGIEVRGQRVVFDDGAPLAAIRRAIEAAPPAGMPIGAYR